MAHRVFLIEVSTDLEFLAIQEFHKHTKLAVKNEDIEPARFGLSVTHLREGGEKYSAGYKQI